MACPPLTPGFGASIAMGASVDIRTRLPAARDQGARPTCLAFAFSDAHLAVDGISDLLSAEFLHFQAARRSATGLNTAVSVAKMQEALRIDGQPLEAECPYADPRSESWRPPTRLVSIRKRKSRLCRGIASAVLSDALGRSAAHVLVVRITRSFFAPDPRSHMVPEDGSTVGLHAVVVVGKADLNGAPSFLIRNSWGEAWGIQGHAWLAASYVDARATHVIGLD